MGYRAVLVGVSFKSEPEYKIDNYLDELEFLAKTAGITTAARFTQRLEKINPKTFVGKGKLYEILDFVKQKNVNLIIFDEELPPALLRNLNNIIKVEIIDRTKLILNIFANHAKTSAAKKQVELAMYQYLLPRLKGMWTHLERQRGGIGLRGPGEKELETDKRIVRDKIAKLKKDLQKIDKQKQTQRKNRGKLVRVALVGYTNVGKSTLMNLLTKDKIYVENKLFATLDTTVRKVAIKNLPFLLADTVGFIRKLPHTLVESFKSTLDEVREADLILHIIDISHPEFESQIQTVENLLTELGCSDKPVVYVFNKIDAYSYIPKDPYDLSPVQPENYSIEDMKRIWISRKKKSVFISAVKKQNIDELKELIYEEVKKIHKQRYPYDDYLFSDEFLK